MLRFGFTHRTLKRAFSTRPGAIAHDGTETVTIKRRLPLVLGGSLPSVEINFSSHGDTGLPVVYIMPSMSHSAHVTRNGDETIPTPGWWEKTAGPGSHFGIDTNKFRVVSAAALGAPYGTSSPLTIDPNTHVPYHNRFPQVTPADQALVHSYLMDHLGIKKVHAVVGASMGGMQTLEFACQFPQKYDRVVSIASTPQTSPSTVALRSVQRAVVQLDPEFRGGEYDPGRGPVNGLGVARQFGTICYRSRDEFDNRFEWKPVARGSNAVSFPVEDYLSHQAKRFQSTYDANCYLLLSKCMDLMDLGRNFKSLSHGIRRVPIEKQVMLLAIAQDALIPAHELEELAGMLGYQGNRVHYECLDSKFGHDAFLVDPRHFNPRLANFLDPLTSDAVTQVRRFVDSVS